MSNEKSDTEKATEKANDKVADIFRKKKNNEEIAQEKQVKQVVDKIEKALTSETYQVLKQVRILINGHLVDLIKTCETDTINLIGAPKKHAEFLRHHIENIFLEFEKDYAARQQRKENEKTKEGQNGESKKGS